MSAEGFSFAIDVFNVSDPKEAAELGDKFYEWMIDNGYDVAMLMTPLNENWERLDNT